MGADHHVHYLLAAIRDRTAARDVVEMQVAFATLARRLPSLKLAAPKNELKFKGTSDIYGMVEHPVSW